eukprot:c46816_g1_i1.p1 GENE.c46816_g1_i1~~c46816_g1_i1.p1  ORF type:complete len:364 (-),score=48.57 c46816_g1_i1:46-1047(-)
MGRADYGFAATCGRRASMEDAMLVRGKLASPDDDLFAVFDGFGGAGASQVAISSFAQLFSEELSLASRYRATVPAESAPGVDDADDEEPARALFSLESAAAPSDCEATGADELAAFSREAGEYDGQGAECAFSRSIAVALSRSFRRLSEAIAASPNVPVGCGTTALVAYLVGDQLFVANAGDTRAVLGRESERHPTRLSTDHKADEPDEVARVRATGASVSCIAGSVPRVEGSIAVTRALHGTRLLADAVTWRPSVSVTTVVGGETVVLATDGLWDRVSDRTATSIARAGAGDCMAAARKLVDFAFSQWSVDNISVLFVSPRALPSSAESSDA